MSRRPILLTGAHRTGTTWAGTVLARASRMYYVHEPFSPNRGEDGGHQIFDRWYEALDDESWEAQGNEIEREIFEGPEAKVARGESKNDGGEIDQNSEASLLGSVRKALRPLRRRVDPILPVVKDPIALLSAPWLARRFDMNVVVMIRHPAGFAASLKRQGWTFPFADLASQPSLMDGTLKTYASEIRDFADTERDLVKQAGLLWKVLYSVVSRYRSEHPHWHFVVYEELTRDPAQGFGELYRKLGLGTIAEALVALEAEKDAPSFAHDPRAWQSELDGDDILELRKATEPVWREFYDDTDWE